MYGMCLLFISSLSLIDSPVVWVPDERIAALDDAKALEPHQTLHSLEDFKPEEWGLPPYQAN